MLLYLGDTEASQFKGQATIMPFWASCLLIPFLFRKTLYTNLVNGLFSRWDYFITVTKLYLRHFIF